MTLDLFNRLMRYMRYPQDDRRTVALRMILVHGNTQAAAARLSGLSPARVSQTLSRVRAEAHRLETFTGEAIPLDGYGASV